MSDPIFSFQTASRLLDVARALREVPKAESKRFTMRIHGWDRDNLHFRNKPKSWCGTPACALGHYAVRSDLQNVMVLKVFNDSSAALMKSQQPQSMNTWFGVNAEEYQDLFGGMGCNDAQEPVAAARYIEEFVLTKVFHEMTPEEPSRDAHAFALEMQDYSRLNARVFEHQFIKPLPGAKVKPKKVPKKVGKGLVNKRRA